ncbi:23S rRNA (guanosine(2251)-2'-O)-methyltransferase RlmB [Sporomusa acidovorans]|uniref:TrmH family tRNA/rRNA methyltransferase n=1 Tax=Sporomusa acidovorans (strain ATCC 49682 / DSM 3132 / Mol) TaxID=1123286 RepID=A0ABZ3IX44_SPOA4|nr:23S rRNA (guanosine(2251)-2'-O)-methyltransferase RlmB [Sporomusa acidovorans]OZC13887.1 putative TrmH family tRNA/rRNA methyltransferase [Sporomusa acidovorans DSM 3132]SDF48889.1 23S rRNA (guanosine2251-2'-O)-methyltransferase [Sporomusa acidovorans]
MSEDAEIIVGRNSVLEALRAGRSLNKILVAKGERQGSIREIISEARERGLIIQEVDVAKLDQLSAGVRHQGVVVMAAPVAYVDIDEILSAAHDKDEPPFLVLLDELADPHNVGAILRTADATGVHGVLIPKRRSCPLTQTVAKTSAGAVEHVPVARIGNIAQTLKLLKKQGLWVVGADMDGTQNYYEADLTGPVVIVVGNEGEGMGRLTKEACDFIVKIPMRGQIASLNASVACSLLLYEVLRQREMRKK